MTIIKRPSAGTPTSTPPPGGEKAIEAFIKGAPDANAVAGQATEATEQISIRVPKALLDRATQMAERQGIPRASYIKRALAMQLQQDEK